MILSLCGFVIFITGRLMSSYALLVVVVYSFFPVLISSVIISLGEKISGLCSSRGFVYFTCNNFYSFSLPLGVRDLLRLVIVTIPGLFY